MDSDPILRPKGRLLTDFLPLHSAEQQLLNACREGMVATIGSDVPQARTNSNLVRGSFLRFLALQGDRQAPVHEHGPELKGAWIEGALDFEGAVILSGLGLFSCLLDSRPIFRDARISGTLILAGCQVPGLDGGRLRCDGGLFLCQAFVATRPVVLTNVQIGGDLDCNGGTFRAALNIERARIWGTVVLRDGFSAIGEVRILDADIGGLDCSNGTFCAQDDGYALTADRATIRGDVSLNRNFAANGRVSFLGARIGGDLRCDGGRFNGAIFPERIEGSCFPIDNHHCALLLDRSEVKGSVFLTDGFSATGRVSLDNARITVSLECGYAVLDGKEGPSLTAAGMVVDGRFVFRELLSPANGVWLCSSHVGYLVDDEKSWGSDIILDGFRYDTIAEVAPTDAQTRLKWLRKQRRSHWESAQDFKPQPWEQLIRSLNAMGHAKDARQVGIAREDHLRQIGRIDKGLLGGLHWIFGKLAAYGYRPERLVYSMLVVWFGCALFFSVAAERGVFAPTNPLVFGSKHYAHCSPVYQPGQYKHPKEKFGNWFLCPDLPEEYTGFSPWLYSLDLLLPVVDLQQERDWAPLIPTPKPNLFRELAHLTFKHWTRLLMWFEILFGWFASLLLIAALTGLANRGKE